MGASFGHCDRSGKADAPTAACNQGTATVESERGCLWKRAHSAEPP